MREMAFLPQEYMIFHQTPPHHHHNSHLHPHHNNRSHHEFDHHDDHHHQQQDPSISLNILSSCPPQDFPGGHQGMATLSFPGFQQDDQENHDHEPEPDPSHQVGGGGEGDELSDDGSQVVVGGGGGGGEKKKRLNMEQVKTLEKNFEQGNKLEPERKMQLAKALGLQPRQVAIWFQNRRARWKTKQLEKDYGVLKRQFDSLKADNESLLALNKKLHAELISLRSRETGGAEYGGGNNGINLNNADTKSYWSNNGSDISSDINLGTSRSTPQTANPLSLSSNKLPNFPPNSFNNISITQLLINQNSSSNDTTNDDNNKPELELIHCPKLDPPIQGDAFCGVFGGGGAGGGDQNQTTAFWAWPEQQHLN